MPSTHPPDLEKLSNATLMRELKKLVGRERELEAELLAYLGEVDARRLYLEEGCTSMFSYCTEVLNLSEGAAYSRITAARAARRFPMVLDRIRTGELHLCGARLLAQNLTPENYIELLDEAANKSKRQIEEILADRAPRPSIRASVRKLPSTRDVPLPLIRSTTPRASDPAAGGWSATARRTSGSATHVQQQRLEEPEPLGQDRFRIQLTADRELYQMFGEARALLRHQIPNGDPAEIFRRGLVLLVKEVRQKRFATGAQRARPKGPAPAQGQRSRHIPAAIRREVHERDGGRCTFVSEMGKRCSAGEFLEFHHRDPWARFREHRVDRIALLCRAHNQYAAELDYSPRHMGKYRRAVAARAEA